MRSTVLKENVRDCLKSEWGRSNKIKLKLQIFSLESLRVIEDVTFYISKRKFMTSGEF